jgi:hypothetical protein
MSLSSIISGGAMQVSLPVVLIVSQREMDRGRLAMERMVLVKCCSASCRGLNAAFEVQAKSSAISTHDTESTWKCLDIIKLIMSGQT